MDIGTDKVKQDNEHTRNKIKPSISRAERQVFDCCIFAGEMDVLAIRLHELDAVVDYFVIVESTLTFSGNPRAVAFDPHDPRMDEFAGKIRHVVVSDIPETTDPWIREKWQRNAVLRGAPDAKPNDLILFSDVDEIPRATVVAQMAADRETEVFGVQMAFSYFYVNYRNVAGPESALTWTVAAVRRVMNNLLPDDLRHFVRDGRIPARIFENGGWHFSYLMDEAGIRRKISAFSHQEFNNAQFLDKIDIYKIVREERDLFDRSGFEWRLVPASDLPNWVLKNREQFSQYFHAMPVADTREQQLRSIVKSAITVDSRFFADVFDEHWYLQKHPDVAAAGVNAYQHYLDAGFAEGRAPAADTAAFIRVGLALYLNKLKSELNQASEVQNERAKLLAEQASENTLRLKRQEQDYERHFRENDKVIELYKAQFAEQAAERALRLQEQEQDYERRVLENEKVVELHKARLIEQGAEKDLRLQEQEKGYERRFREREELVELSKAHNIQMRQLLEQSERREVLLTTRLASAGEAGDAQVASLQRVIDQTVTELNVLRMERKDVLALQEAIASREQTLTLLRSQYAAQETRLAEISEHFASLSANQADPSAAANSLNELLQYHANQFVECAYITLLRRPPDPEGRQFYLSRVLEGSPKLQVLKELSESEEARKIGFQLPGLPEALHRYHLASNPLWRLFFPSLARSERDSADQNRLRAIEQRLFINNHSARAMDLRFATHRAEDAAAVTPCPERIESVTDTSALVPFRCDKSYIPPADGKWEWADYGVVKERIANFKQSRAEKFAPKPLELIDIGDGPYFSVLSEIVLPVPRETPDVSIILPVFNNLKLTLECLLSISKHVDPSVTFEVLVCDDASTDDTVKVITTIRNLRLARNPENLGFLRNCNRAINSVRGRYVVFLNNDVQVSKGWLRILLATFSKFPKVGAVGPRYVYPNGRLQEAGAAFRPDATAQMIGLGEDPEQARFAYARRVDYTSGACLMLPTPLLKELNGFSEEYLPCYCEDSDLCLRVQELGYFVYCNPEVVIVHHLSKTTAALNDDFKYQCVGKNLNTLAKKWANRLEKTSIPRVLAFFLPQFHPFPENNVWWGEGFTEWTNVTKAQPNFEGHYQPRYPADLGYYDLRLPEAMAQQADLARRYGIDGFCFYYYWFGGKRLLDAPIEAMLASKAPDFPFCLCWANENWSRRWDGRDSEILMSQQHSPEDDLSVIRDLVRYFMDSRYIRVDGRPLMLIYRVQLFPNFAQTAERWRTYCRETGIGEIYLAMVESFELVHSRTNPSVYGCDASVEFPPQEMAETKAPSGKITNPSFVGNVADFRDLAVKFATRELPDYKRLLSVAPGWDNTARMQDRSFCFEYSTPGAFQAWLEEAIELTRTQYYGDERLIFVNAWNEWAEGAYLEPDRRFGHAFLEAVRNAKQAALLLRRDTYGLGG